MQHRPQPFTAAPLAEMILKYVSAGDYDMTLEQYWTELSRSRDEQPPDFRTVP